MYHKSNITLKNNKTSQEIFIVSSMRTENRVSWSRGLVHYFQNQNSSISDSIHLFLGSFIHSPNTHLFLKLPFVMHYARLLSVSKLCLTLCNPMDGSMPGFPVLQHLPEFAQTHVYGVSDTIQPSHSLLPHSPPDLNLSQDQDLFQ